MRRDSWRLPTVRSWRESASWRAFFTNGAVVHTEACCRLMRYKERTYMPAACACDKPSRARSYRVDPAILVTCHTLATAHSMVVPVCDTQQHLTPPYRTPVPPSNNPAHPTLLLCLSYICINARRRGATRHSTHTSGTACPLIFESFTRATTQAARGQRTAFCS